MKLKSKFLAHQNENITIPSAQWLAIQELIEILKKRQNHSY